MGVYYYRVEAKARKLADGHAVHVMHYAYKPRGDWSWNDKMERLKLGPTYRAWGNKPNPETKDVLVAHEIAEGAVVYRMKFCSGVLSDAADHPMAGKLTKAGRGWRLVGVEELRHAAQVEAAQRAELDALWAANTGFKNLDDCLNAGGNYRPSLDMRQPVMVRLANDYDAAQAARGDERRAYRYGA